MTLFDKLAHVTARKSSYWSERIAAQMNYAARLSSVNGGEFDALLGEVADFILASSNDEGVITRSCAAKAEEMLAPVGQKAKALKVVCVSHAHIDMNWMWGFQETAAVTIDTFRTILELMKQYPTFTYSQSQASVYRIVEETDPDMLEEIRARVKEGRWEITASTWVENDKNMPNGESMARHILYTKKYLSKLMDVPEESMKLDFEPDTFGHNWTLPEIMNAGGVRYYYHCRAYDGEYVYRWRARSGAEVLVYREPSWYNADIGYDMMTEVPQFCAKYGIDQMLRVYGVGDHGGGPTRRDIERLIDMETWPIMPTIEFGTYHAFYKHLETFREKLPVVDQELNFVFTGCYTSQSRIKMSNRLSEDRLYSAEALGAVSTALGGRSFAPSFAKAWENVLFNHFHDILPGSGMIETREYAMGLFQKTLALANTNSTSAINRLSGMIDTSAIPFHDDKHTVSEGGGVGMAVDQANRFVAPQTERGRGKVRAITLYNPTEFDREGPEEITVWDWHYDHGLMSFTDSKGNPVAHKITHGGSGYWGHVFFKAVIYAKVPAFGYATYILDERQRDAVPPLSVFYDRKDYISDDDIVLQNNKIKATFDAVTMALKSYVDLATGEEMVAPDRPAAIFRLIHEDDVHGMTSWRVGQYMTILNLNGSCDVRVYDKNLGGIRKWVRYEVKFASSSLNVTVSLDDNSPSLKFGAAVDWHEIGRPGQGVPQLNFYMPLGYHSEKYRYDIPFSTIDRDGANHDMPGNSFAVALNAAGGRSVQVVTDSKYGFRTSDDSVAVDLIRSSYDPDPYPELGKHTINLAVAIPEDTCNRTLFRTRDSFVHLLPFISNTKHGGSLPLDGSFLKVAGDVRVSAVKTAEKDDKVTVIRLSDANGKGAESNLEFFSDLSAACVMDINETMVVKLTVSGKSVKVKVAPYQVVTIGVKF